MTDEIIDDITKLISHGRQLWLLGAGASLDAKLPLISGLTARVRWRLKDRLINSEDAAPLTASAILDGICAEIGPRATVETILDQIADYLSVANRGAAKTIALNLIKPGEAASVQIIPYADLVKLHGEILTEIRDTLRWGYVHNDKIEACEEGTNAKPILDIRSHEDFINTLFQGLRAGRELRVNPIEFFTTNYDTLIEDALSLGSIPYADGFTGGALAYWNPALAYGATIPERGIHATITKIHGSIDWCRSEGRIMRRRISDPYPVNVDDLLIYPRALKYDHTRREPFDTLFQQFRISLGRSTPQVMMICGYGFGDDHVDQEIEAALRRPDSQLTVVVFCMNHDGKPERWQSEVFGERIYTVTSQGIWRGREGPFLVPAEGKTHNWWTFTGMTKFLAAPGASS